MTPYVGDNGPDANGAADLPRVIRRQGTSVSEIYALPGPGVWQGVFIVLVSVT